MTDPFKTIVIDPPWNEQGGGGRGAQNHYDLMTTPKIQELLLEQVGCGKPLLDQEANFEISQDAHCWIWVTTNFLPDGLELMKVLGFDYKRTLVWVKATNFNSEDTTEALQIGLGQYARGSHELCLFGSRGKAQVPAPENRPPDVLFAERQEHSKKPEGCFSQWFEKVSPGPYLELFSREKRKGWEVWGNEV